MLIREQFSLSSAWFGQHFVAVGYLGGEVRSDLSSLRQSPRLAHGGDKQVSFKAGTHTSLSLHSWTGELPSATQFGNPHHRLEHFVSLCSPQRQELHRFVSKTSSLEKEHFGGEFESTVKREKNKTERKREWLVNLNYHLKRTTQHNEERC